MSSFVKGEILEADVLNIFKRYGVSVKKTYKSLENVNFNEDVIVKIQVTENSESQEIGFLLLICPKDVSIEVAIKFFDMKKEDISKESLAECICELINMIGGNLQESLKDASLDIPILIRSPIQFNEIKENIAKADFFYEVASVNSETNLLQLTTYSHKIKK